RIVRVRQHEARAARNSWDQIPRVESFRQGMTATQSLESHVMDRDDVGPAGPKRSEKVRVVAEIRLFSIEDSRQQGMQVERANGTEGLLRIANVSVRMRNLELQRLMRENEEARLVVERGHSPQNLFAVITDSGLTAVEDRSIKRYSHAASRCRL